MAGEGMKAIYVIWGILCFATAFADAYNFVNDNRKVPMKALELAVFGLQAYMAVYCAIKAAML